MIRSIATPIVLHDLEPEVGDFRTQVRDGLRRPRKQLSCKFFYDQRGSDLFDQICELEEYYLTRTELNILSSHIESIAAALERDCMLVEYGSGTSLKTRMLLDHLQSPAAYVPIDISRSHLLNAARAIAHQYQGLRVLPVCADYTKPLTLPRSAPRAGRTVVFFPGSTIGNFEPSQARRFLSQARQQAGPKSGLLIGVDLKKDPRALHAAYNDAAGVTAAFNLNLLERINRELDGDFDLDRFAHYAFFNPSAGRIEMHLTSLADQSIRVSGERFDFEQGESIFTECSYKYTPAGFSQLAAAAGYRQVHCWMDPAVRFAIFYFESIG